MGLASKMAAIQQQPPAGGQYQQQQQQYAPPGGAPPPQQGGYAPPSYAPPPGAPPPTDQKQQYASPSGPPPSAGYAPPPGAPPAQRQMIDPAQIERILTQCVSDQDIKAFYPPGSLAPIARKISQSGALEKVAAMMRMPLDNKIMGMAKLALFDTALLLDDSGSMAFSKWNGERLDDLNLILSRVSSVASLFDDDGISVRFLNSTKQGNGIRNEQGAMDLLFGMEYKYMTPLGGALGERILQPLVLGPAEAGRLQKPVLVIIITDGAPSDGDLIFRVIKDANKRLKKTRYGPDALSIQVAQVGNDLEATEFLSSLDEDKTIGGLVDCTSNYEVESAEMKQKTGIDLTPEGWLIKLMMGGIDSSYDAQDETVGGSSSAPPKKKGGLRNLFK